MNAHSNITTILFTSPPPFLYPHLLLLNDHHFSGQQLPLSFSPMLHCPCSPPEHSLPPPLFSSTFLHYGICVSRSTNTVTPVHGTKCQKRSNQQLRCQCLLLHLIFHIIQQQWTRSALLVPTKLFPHRHNSKVHELGD